MFINDVPEEILILILELTLDPFKPQYSVGLLELVCRRWRRTVESTPSFWTNILASEGMGWVSRALVNSKDASLDISYDPVLSDMGLPEIIPEIGPHMLRWRSLAVSANATFFHSSLAQLLAVLPPRLEVLHLSRSDDNDTEEPPVELFTRKPWPAKLREVSLAATPLNINPSALQNITSLSLFEISSIPWDTIIKVLNPSPNIHLVELVNVPNSLPPQYPLQPLHLPQLEDLYLVGVDRSVISLLLSVIHAPHCRGLNLACTVDNRPITETLLTPAVAHWRPVIRKMAKNADFVELDRRTSNGMYEIKVGGFEIQLDALNPAQLHETLNWTLEVLDDGNGLPGPQIWLSIDDSSPQDYHFQPPLSQAVTGLTLLGWTTGVVRPNWVLAALREPRETEPHWVFPNLKVIDFRLGMVCLEELLQTLKVRHETVEASLPNGSMKGAQLASITAIHVWYHPHSREERHRLRECLVAIRRILPHVEINLNGNVFT